MVMAVLSMVVAFAVLVGLPVAGVIVNACEEPRRFHLTRTDVDARSAHPSVVDPPASTWKSSVGGSAQPVRPVGYLSGPARNTGDE